MPQLAPVPRFTAYRVDGDGNLVPMVGGKLYSYTAGTTTPKATYDDATLGSANTNPVILDADGQADVWLDGAYKLRLLDASDVLQWEVDAIADQTKDQTFTNSTLAGTLTVTSTAVTWSGNPTHSGNHTFSNNLTVNGNTTLGNANTDTLTIAPNAVTWSNNPTHSGNHTFSGNLSLAAGQIVAGTFTPTLTNVTNISASSAFLCNYLRVGAVVTVSGFVTIDPTAAAGTPSELGISLPIASNFTSGEEAGGVGILGQGSSIGDAGPIGADVTNNRLMLSFLANDLASRNWAFHATYRIV